MGEGEKGMVDGKRKIKTKNVEDGDDEDFYNFFPKKKKKKKEKEKNVLRDRWVLECGCVMAVGETSACARVRYDGGDGYEGRDDRFAR